MPQDIPNPLQEAAADGCSCSAPKPRSLDFRGRGELNWSAIEEELLSIATKATAIEVIGRSAVEDIHEEKLSDVFEMLASHLHGDVERLKELLGIGREVES